jgi:CheY-like chemotaxis protein
MPRLDGFGALREIREREAARRLRRTPVVAITASVIDQDRASMLAFGFDEYLGKPFREQVIFDLCTQLLGARFETEAPAAAASDPPLLSGDLRALDPAWRAVLASFVTEGDVEGSLAHVDALEGHDALAGRLRLRLKAYRLEELLQALETP